MPSETTIGGHSESPSMDDEGVPAEAAPAKTERPALRRRRRRRFARHERNRERVARRQEVFSDIVIGFSLAEIGLSLVIPPHAIDFVTHLAPLFAFFVTFATIIGYWRVSDLIFETYFVPSPLATALNFFALACLILEVFALQLYLHFVPLAEGVVASRIYFAFFSLAYGVQAVLLVLGGVLRWSELSASARRLWVRLSLGRIGMVTGMTLGNAFATNDQAKIYMMPGMRPIDLTNPPASALVANFPASIAGDAFIGVIAGLVLAFALARFVPALHDAPPQA